MSTLQPRDEAADISSGKRKQATWFQILRDLLDKKVRILQMLDGVPHGDDVKCSTEIEAKIVSLRRFDASFLNGEADGFSRNVDAGRGPDPLTRLLEKKAISAADLEKVTARKVWSNCLECRKSIAKIESQAGLLGDIVQIFLTLEVALAIQDLQLLIRNTQIRRQEAALVALNKTGKPLGRRMCPAANNTYYIAGLACGSRV